MTKFQIRYCLKKIIIVIVTVIFILQNCIEINKSNQNKIRIMKRINRSF